VWINMLKCEQVLQKVKMEQQTADVSQQK
jgi:hypothetical protein